MLRVSRRGSQAARLGEGHGYRPNVANRVNLCLSPITCELAKSATKWSGASDCGEALGGIGRRGARCLCFLARRASCRKRGRDGTTYSRFHPSNYLSHHLAGIVTAAVFSDAAHIAAEIALLKTRTSGATRTAAAADPIE